MASSVEEHEWEHDDDWPPPEQDNESIETNESIEVMDPVQRRQMMRRLVVRGIEHVTDVTVTFQMALSGQELHSGSYDPHDGLSIGHFIGIAKKILNVHEDTLALVIQKDRESVQLQAHSDACGNLFS